MMTRVATRASVITAADTCGEFSTPEQVDDGRTASLPCSANNEHPRAEPAACKAGTPRPSLENANPKDPIARMRGHMAEMARLFGGDDELVNEVQA